MLNRKMWKRRFIRRWVSTGQHGTLRRSAYARFRIRSVLRARIAHGLSNELWTTHNKAMLIVRAGLVLALSFAAYAQTLTNASLTGRYFARHVEFTTDANNNVTDARSIEGAITFGGDGLSTGSPVSRSSVLALPLRIPQSSTLCM